MLQLLRTSCSFYPLLLLTNCLTTTTFTEGGLYLGEIGDSLKTRRAEAFTGPTVMFSRRTI